MKEESGKKWGLENLLQLFLLHWAVDCLINNPTNTYFLSGVCTYAAIAMDGLLLPLFEKTCFFLTRIVQFD